MKQRKGFQRVAAMLMALIMIASTLLPSSGVQAAVTEKKIEISKIGLIRNNGDPYNNSSGDSWLRLHLSESDYASGGAVASGITNGDTSWFKTYGTLDKIKIYTNESEEPVALKDILDTTTGVDQNVYCPFFDSNTIAFNITNNYDGKTITKVVIEKGAAFPSQTDRSGTVYVTTKDMIATTKDTSQYQNDSGWNYTRVEDTTVTRFENFTSAEGDPGRLFFTLGTTDLTDSVTSKIFTHKELGTKYNMLDYILFYTKAGEYKKAREVMQNLDEFYWNLWTRWDSISFKTTLKPADVKFVLIKKGCEFPSYAEDQNYGTATLSTVYRTATDIVFNMNNGASSTSETPITGVSGTEVPTELSGLEILHNTDEDYRLRVKLTTNDYTSAPASEELAANWQYRYNMLDMIDLYLDGQETPVSLRQAATGTDGHFNLWGSTGAFSLKMTGAYNGTTIRKVVFKKGCQLPSYGMEKETGTNIYVLTEDEVFESTNLTNVANTTNWNKVDTSVPYDTSVTQIIGGHNGGTQLSFLLSANDYTEATKPFSTASSKEMQYNFLDKIEVYTTSDKMYKLGDTAIYDVGANSFYKMHDKANNITIGLKVSASSISKIVIPAGTVFPSYAYSIGQNAKKYGYRTTEAITFVNQNDTSQTNPWDAGTCWSVYEEPANIETTISKIQVRGDEGKDNDYLFVYLNDHDYSTQAYVENHFDEYEDILTKIELSTAGDTKTLQKVMTDEPARYNRYNENGCITFGLKSGWNGTTIKRITFKQGAEFPSYNYTNGSATSKKAYVLPEDITYTTPVSKWSNEEWYEYYEPVVNKTEITNIHVRNGFVLLFLSNHDYEEIPAEKKSFWPVDTYNLTDMITVTTADGTKKLSDILPTEAAKKEAYYNIWTETGCFAIKMDDTKYNGETIQKVAIKKGAEFPSYTYTSGGTKAKTSYVTEKDYVFNTGKQTEADNTSWTKVTPYSSATDITDVSVSGSKLTFTLSKNDYISGEVGGNHTDFDYWNNVQVYTSNTECEPLYKWADSTSATYDSNTLSVTGSGEVVRVVIPAKTVFPSYKYTSGQIGECVGYYVAGEKVFEKQGETWTDVSREVSKVSGDVNGDKKVNSLDIIAMAKYAKNGYGYNASSLTYDETKTEAGNRHIVRRVILGHVLHNYEKESDSLTYFSSSDMELDSFLNDFYKRQVGYNDYVEGDMTVTSYKPGTTYSSIYNLPWLTKSLLWVDSKNSLESDRTAQLKKQIESIIVDRYGYVWNGDDAVEDPTLGIGKKHGMGWPFPNALHAGNSGSTGDTTNVRSWEFNTKDTLSKWTSSLSDESLSNGLYQGTANSTTRVTFTVEDYGYPKSPIIRKTSCAPWLTFELRMNGVTNPENIEDIYVKWVNSDSNTEYEVKAGDIAAVNYGFTEDYEHVLYLPMYTNKQWNDKEIKKITIEIHGNAAFSGTFALNYVRPSFDTRHSNNNANYIEALKEYYNMTGDVGFVRANIIKARKAMNFYLQMYDKDQKLNQQSYLYGHDGDKTSLASGLGNGYWDILYTPVYDFQSNMYFYQALQDLSYLEDVLSTNGISVNESATITTARPGVIGSSTYSKNASDLKTIANDVVSKMRTYFWNANTGRFMAGYDNSNNKVDYGYTVWNLEAIERGIATDDQKTRIMSWIDGEADIYGYEFAPRTATENKTGIYGAFIENGGNATVKDQAFGESLQFGGAVMYSSYYDLTSRIQVNGADDALTRLKGIQTWYDDVSNYFNENNGANADFYFDYFVHEGTKPQNGSKDGYGNGAVGVDGEFTESLLVAAAIPYGFFGMDSEGGNTLCVTPNLPSTMDHWKVENMQYNGVTYDLSTYKDAVRIDSVRGTTTGLSVKVTLDCPAGKDIYVDGVAKNVTRVDGKATVTVPFGQTLVEVK